MKCFVCRTMITSTKTLEAMSFGMTEDKTQWASQQIISVPIEPEHVTLSLSSTPEAKLFFHKQCFVEVAGEEFTETIEHNHLNCVMCLENAPRTEIGPFNGKPKRGLICDECAKLAPQCNPCKKDMTLRFSHKNKSLFWSCIEYPSCKNSKSVI